MFERAPTRRLTASTVGTGELPGIDAAEHEQPLAIGFQHRRIVVAAPELHRETCDAVCIRRSSSSG